MKKLSILMLVLGTSIIAPAQEIKDELENPAVYENDRKNAWKFDFLSPQFGHTGFAYERSLKPGFSLEAGFGIIGLGKDHEGNNPQGAYLRFGPRFMRTPDFRQGSLRYAHVLKGAYVQPQVLLGGFGSDVDYYDIIGGTIKTGRETTTYGSLMLTFGKQNVFANRFLVDCYAGFGYGFQNTTTKNKPAGNQGEHFNYRRTYGALTGNSDFPIAASLGVKIGFLTR